MTVAYGRLDMSGGKNTQADHMQRTITDWIDRNWERITFDFPTSELHRRIGRVVYGGELTLRLDGVDFTINRRAVLEGLP